MINLLSRVLVEWKAARAARRDHAERKAVATVWNDRYCYRVLFDDKAERLTGTAMFMILPIAGNRWMCPDCNRIHAPTKCSVFSGLQYPACCSTAEGHRLDHGIRVS